MAESVDALVSNTSGAIRAGSIPAPGTTKSHKQLIFNTYGIFLFAKTSNLVTFGHHLKNGGLKTPQKGSKKMSEISLFEGKCHFLI